MTLFKTILFAGIILMQVAVALHLVMPVILYTCWRIRRLTGGTTAADGHGELPDETVDFAVIITAFRQTHQLDDVIGSVLEGTYPLFQVYVVADGCAEGSYRFDHPRVTVLFPEKTIASNTGSHRYAIDRFIRPHAWFLILDSDNLMDPAFLQRSLKAIRSGFDALQGVRAPKNLDSYLSRLDAARDLFYHFYDGRLLFGLGSSATLAGSGMAFRTQTYLEALAGLEIRGAGFDKVLQYQLVKQGHRIAYLTDAVVLDEKSSQSDQFVNQRARWLNTWFRYAGFGGSLLAKGILSLRLNPFLFGITLLRPPLFLLLLFSVTALLVNAWFFPWLGLLWGLALALFCLSFFIALRESPTDPRIYRSLYKIPVFIGYQLKALFFSARANQRSIATDHRFRKNADPSP